MKIIKDLAQRTKGKVNPWIFLGYFFLDAGFQAVILYRLGHFLYKIKLEFLAMILRRLMVTLCGADISYMAEIEEGFILPHPVGVAIGRKVHIGKNTAVFSGVILGGKGGHGEEYVADHPAIGEGCVIAAGAKVLGEISIGSYVTVGANAVVVESIPDHVTVGGIPARLLEKKGEL